MKTLTDAIVSLYPLSSFILHNEDYDRLEWFDTSIEKPSREVLEQELDRITELDNLTKYQRDRAVEYPPLSELADALYWQSKGNTQPMTNYIAACEAVKVKYPKGV
jgi:hypothetical protein